MSGNSQSMEARRESGVVASADSGAGGAGGAAPGALSGSWGSSMEIPEGFGSIPGGDATRGGSDGGAAVLGLEAGRLSPNGGFGRGAGPSDSALTQSGTFPCSTSTQDTLGGIGTIETMETDQDLGKRRSRSRIPLSYRPGATPPSLNKPLAIHGGNEMEVEDSAGLSPGGREVRMGLFTQTQKVSTPPGEARQDLDRVADRVARRNSQSPPTQDTEILFSSTMKKPVFEYSNEYAEDGFTGNQNEIPANLALNNPIGVQRELKRNELPWSLDGWQLDDKGCLVSQSTGERRKLDQFQRAFWKRREKNLIRVEKRRREAKEEAIRRAAEIKNRMEKRKRESEEASRTLDLHKKGRLETVDPRDQEELDPE